MMLMQGVSQVSQLRTVRKRNKRAATSAFNFIVQNKGYTHSDHGPLIIALLDEDHSLTYEHLRDLNKFRFGKKDEGNDAAHGPLPEPDEYYDEMVTETLDVACGGSAENPIYQKIEPWTERYARLWPNNTPTKMQRRLILTPRRPRRIVASSEQGLRNRFGTPSSASDNSDDDDDLDQQDNGGNGGGVALLPLFNNAVPSPQRSA
jgi:hypothetical protein